MPFKVYSGAKFFRVATTFMVACRERDPLAGLCDTGELHWWWRDAAFAERDNQRFWEGRDAVLGMLVLSERYATLGYQILPGLEMRDEARALFAEGLAWLERFDLAPAPVRPAFYLQDPPPAVSALAQQAGFEDTGTARIHRYREPLPLPVAPLAPPGFHIRSLAARHLVRGAPPLLNISAENFAEIREASHYHPELHLVLETHEGEVAAESLCWWDETTATAMFEPVRVARAYTRRGLARDLMIVGLKRVSQRGARIVKSSHDKHHHAAARLYGSLGFNRVSEQRLFVQRS